VPRGAADAQHERGRPRPAVHGARRDSAEHGGHRQHDGDPGPVGALVGAAWVGHYATSGAGAAHRPRTGPARARGTRVHERSGRVAHRRAAALGRAERQRVRRRRCATCVRARRARAAGRSAVRGRDSCA
jgi:hypothetical protein